MSKNNLHTLTCIDIIVIITSKQLDLKRKEKTR